MHRTVTTLGGCLAALGLLTQSARTAASDVQPTIDRAVAYLVERQSDDGAWRSDVYGPFRTGDALTAHAALALMEAAPREASLGRAAALAKGRDFLASFAAADGRIHPPEHGLAYPLYTAADAVIVLSRSDDAGHATARDAWLGYLRQRQLTEALGWSAGDAEFGGWGSAEAPTSRPGDGRPLGDLAEPNLSATVFALAALRSAGVAVDDPAVRKACRFVERCQNVAVDGRIADPRFDDGGFVFVLDDPVRNKAGAAGVDTHGRRRFASYGSATVDGLRALLLCGAPDDDPRVVAAWKWLDANFSADSHPGKYAADRQAARESVYYYYCHSLAALLSASSRDSATQARAQRLASRLLEALSIRQQADGSWRNTAVDVREDDPLVATPLALMAVVRCRQLLLACPAAP